MTKAPDPTGWSLGHLSQEESRFHVIADGDREVSNLVQAAASADFYVGQIPCRSVDSKADLLDAFATSLSFPEYFGRNWDALDECLTDMSWLGAAGYVLAMTGADSLFRRLPNESARLVDILANTMIVWGRRSKPFHVVLFGDPSSLASFVSATLGHPPCVH